MIHFTRMTPAGGAGSAKEFSVDSVGTKGLERDSFLEIMAGEEIPEGELLMAEKVGLELTEPVVYFMGLPQFLYWLVDLEEEVEILENQEPAGEP